jgi:hypothetical protein
MLRWGFKRIMLQLDKIEIMIIFLFQIFKFIHLLIDNLLITYKLRDFWYEAQKKANTYTREREIPAWNDMAIWKNFRPPYISKAIWADYIQHMTSAHFTRGSQSGTENRHRLVHDSVITHTSGSVPFVSHVKRMVRFFL